MSASNHDNLNRPHADAKFHAILDASLGADAASEAMTDRIFAATVDRLPRTGLDAVLDEALAPSAMPAGLVERVVSRTRRQLDRAAGVLARIGPWSIRRRLVGNIAAAVVLAASIGVLMTGFNIVNDARQIVEVRQEIVALSGYATPAAPIDQEIELLAGHVDRAMAGGDWVQTRDMIDQALTDLEIDLVGSWSSTLF